MSDNADRSFEDAIKHVKLSSVPCNIRWQLAWHLDSPCSIANWKSLAEKFGLPSPMIMSIEDRVCYTSTKSCTLLFFKECLIPHKISLDQLVRDLAAIKNLACIHVLKEAFNNGHLKASNENENNVMQLQTYSVPAVIHSNINENDENQAKKIFLTYSEESCNTAKSICRWLMRHGCIVSLDILERRLLQENRMGWYDKKCKEADYVLILVSPQYAEDIDGCGTSKLSPMTLYIHKLLQAEYLNNNCINKRFIPIVLPGAVKDQGPQWLMDNTIPYYWPGHYRLVYCRIHDSLLPKCPNIQHTPIITVSRV